VIVRGSILVLETLDQTRIEEWTETLTLIVLGFFLLGTLVAWLVMTLMRPRSRSEWGEWCKATVIIAVVFRAFFARFTGIQIDAITDFIFWLAMVPLIAFFAVNVLVDWSGITWRMLRRNRRLQMYIGGGVILVILVIILLIWIL
jgi:hypothetical protein